MRWFQNWPRTRSIRAADVALAVRFTEAVLRRSADTDGLPQAGHHLALESRDWPQNRHPQPAGCRVIQSAEVPDPCSNGIATGGQERTRRLGVQGASVH